MDKIDTGIMEVVVHGAYASYRKDLTAGTLWQEVTHVVASGLAMDTLPVGIMSFQVHGIYWRQVFSGYHS